MKKTILDCEQQLVEVPPADFLSKYDYNVVPPRADLEDKDKWKEIRGKLSAQRSKREAYMVCHLISAVNEAARYLKINHCNAKGNLNSSWNIYSDPTDF